MTQNNLIHKLIQLFDTPLPVDTPVLPNDTWSATS